MELVKLGNTNVSRIILGGLTFGTSLNKSQTFRLLDLAVDYGVNFIDTAEVYPSPLKAEHYGISETLIGEWLKTKPKNFNIHIQTKVTGPEDAKEWDIAPWVRGKNRKVDRKNILEAINGSLSRLGVDQVFIYMPHWPERNVPLEEITSTFQQLMNEGKIQHWGTSNEGPVNMPKLIEFCNQHNKPLPIAQTMLYNMLHRNPEESGLYTTCYKNSIGITAYCPLAMGVLTGKYSEGLLNGRLETWPDYYKERFGNEQARIAALEYQKLSYEIGIPLHHIALAWLLKQNITGIIIGVSKIEQFLDNLECLNVVLTDDVMQKIDFIYKIIGNPVIGI